MRGTKMSRMFTLNTPCLQEETTENKQNNNKKTWYTIDERWGLF